MIKAMVAAGVDPQTPTYIVARLVSPGMPPAMPPPKSTFVPPFFQPGSATVEYVNDSVPIAAGNRIDVGDRIVEVAMRLEKPCVVLFNNVLSSDECARVIEMADPRLKPSTVVDPATGKSTVTGHRVSDGMYFRRGENDFLDILEERIARLLNAPKENGEGLAILRYKVGGDQYHPHHDYFPPQNPGSHKRMVIGGQRVSTLITYLNDVDAGGETFFPKIGLSVTPKKGSAIYFQYCNAAGQLDPLAYHGGKPIIAGEKWIMTKWMRQRFFGLPEDAPA
jgi:prolyl 4-hydroxylase